MSEAIFGLVGVIVGAIVTGGVDIALGAMRRRDATAVAKRLVAEELHTIWTHVVMLRDEQRVPQSLDPDLRERFLPTSSWIENRATLAHPSALSDPNWIEVSAVFSAARSLRDVVLRLEPLSQVPAELDAPGFAETVANAYVLLTGQRPEALG